VFADLLLNVGGRRVDRRSYSASFLVGLLTGVDGARGKSVRLLLGHIVEDGARTEYLIVAAGDFADCLPGQCVASSNREGHGLQP